MGRTRLGPFLKAIAPIAHQHGASDVPCLVGEQEADLPGHFLRTGKTAEYGTAFSQRLERGFAAAEVRDELLEMRGLGPDRGVDLSRCDSVDADMVCRVLGGGDAGEVGDGRLA